MKYTLNSHQLNYLAKLEKELTKCEVGTLEWWDIVESIDSIKHNL